MRSIRFDKYTDEWLKLVHEKYQNDTNCITCTYYKLDIDNSVCDKDKLFNGSYEIVGDLSGLKWKKIELLPITFMADIGQIDLNGEEKGHVANIQLTATLPSQYGVVPNGYDFLIFNSKVLFPETKDQTTFVVSGQNRSNIGTSLFYQFTMNNIYINTDDLDSQSNEYVFVEFEKKIYPKDIGIELLTLLSFDYSIHDLLPYKYDTSRGIYYLNK